MRQAALLESALVLSVLVSGVHAQTQHIARVGVRPDGRQIGPEIGQSVASTVTSLSDDGRWVLVGDTSQFIHAPIPMWLLDRSTGSMTQFVSGLGGAQPNHQGFNNALISGDGTCIAFDTNANNVVAGDAGVDTDVFWVQRASGQLLRLSVGIGGEPNGQSNLCAIGLNGRFVTFESEASNIVPNDTNGGSDVFRFDTATGQVVRVSVATGGGESIGASYRGAMSHDGRFVAFLNNGDDLTPGDTNGTNDVYVRDLLAGTTELVSQSTAGFVGNQDSSGGVSISRDGRFVAFGSHASNLVPNDTNGRSDAFLRDRLLGTTTRLDVSTSGAETNDDTVFGLLAGDGNAYFFVSLASNLIASDTNVRYDLFLRDLTTLTTVRVNTTPSGGENTQTSWYPGVGLRAVSYDGRFIALDSQFSDLIAGDSNVSWDGFVVDRAANVAPVTTYCTAKYTSSGCLPSITSAGAPRATGWDSFYVCATQLPANVNGAFAWSLSSAALPFGGGTLCVGAPKGLTRGLNSGSYGGTVGYCSQGQFVFKLTQAFLASHALAPGVTVYGQFICRDNGFAQPNNYGLSNGISFTIAP